MLRIRSVEPLDDFRLRLTLSDGSMVVRSVGDVLTGPVFERLRQDEAAFRAVAVSDGTVVWPSGADIDPDVLIWGGPAPGGEATPPTELRSVEPSRA